jgi:hypothetical protein
MKGGSSGHGRTAAGAFTVGRGARGAGAASRCAGGCAVARRRRVAGGAGLERVDAGARRAWGTRPANATKAPALTGWADCVHATSEWVTSECTARAAAFIPAVTALLRWHGRAAPSTAAVMGVGVHPLRTQPSMRGRHGLTGPGAPHTVLAALSEPLAGQGMQGWTSTSPRAYVPLAQARQR